jgi:hypothetical protein
MIQANRNVIKANDVKMSGTVTLSNGGQSRAVSMPVQQNTQQSTHVTIVESNEQFAVIQVNCGCGEKIHIKCDYAGSSVAVENQ